MARNVIGAAVCAALVAGCGGGSNASAPASSSNALPVSSTPGPVVFMGDSITARWGDSTYASPVLSQLVQGSVNQGVPGQNSEQMLARLQTDVLRLHPFAVVIEAGTNDLAEVTNYGRSSPGLPATVDAIAQMADEAQQSGARVYIASVIEVSMPQYGVSATDIASFNQQLKLLCAGYGYTYVDYQTALELNGVQSAADFLPDNVHPSPAGYTTMWQVLEPLL